MSEMEKKKKLPIGVDLFEKIIEMDYYYVDKTMLVRRILDELGDINLFTRPRRFGKTLNMSMLKSFFEIGTDPSMFDGLAISQDRELCDAYQGKYPVVFLSLKGVSGLNYQEAMEMLSMLIANECARLSFLLQSDKVEEQDRRRMERLYCQKNSAAELRSALVILMRMLHAHYGKKVILLIDEYDVPLDKANENGYYSEMVNFLRGFFEEAFKTNPDLCFAVVTGCLRISKESIFTGINNLKVDTIADERFGEFFGFTDAEVRKLLEDYGLSDAYEGIKEWYDGYRFGKTDVYCPWDVINHCDRLRVNPETEPDLYWDNSSSNQLVRRLIDVSDAAEQRDIERLIAGEALEKKLILNLTYDELNKKELLWSVLYQTGYLTQDRAGVSRRRGMARLELPNREIRELFIEKVQEWFAEKVAEPGRAGLYEEIWNGDAAALQERIRNILLDTISYHDYHENYYHALLTGLLLNGRYPVRSNYEMGMGRSDIVVEDDRNRRAALIETKRSANYEDLENDSKRALEQIREKQYAWPYQRKKYQVIAYGISFADKDCCVRAQTL